MVVMLCPDILILYSMAYFLFQEDNEMLQKQTLSESERLCVQLRSCEKNILKSAAIYASQRKQKLQAQTSS